MSEYRRSDALERAALPPGRDDLAWIAAAKLSGDILVSAIECAGLVPESFEPRILTFDEKIDLIASGKRKLVPVLPIRKADPDFTLGGVCW